ncbi:MAG: HAD hydrolase-like protein [Prevotella sp.]|nr:HAD hydrolase-like protein [Alistipes senegalensis]MCM1358415.1 HAD hydrolase-like protein [Prevotella sp.]MCM1473791.1 HAD hydrolase-like protein [Muribaculaceae bacterium]
MTNLVFDYDGTIHNSMKTYAPAFRNTCKWLYENGYIKKCDYSDRQISYWLGFNSTDMWEQFQPELSPAIREKARVMLGEDMAQRVENGEGALFENAENVLETLKNNGYNLIFLSNCRVHYMERHKRVFCLERFFSYFYCCEDFGFIPKYEIFRKIKPCHDGDFIVIGDRFHDIETAVKNNLHSIGCGYGYGTPEELSGADIIVNDITEIPVVLTKFS